MDDIADSSQTNISGVTVIENKPDINSLNQEGITSAAPNISRDDGNGNTKPIKRNILDPVNSIGIIIGVVLGLAGIIWFFVSLIIEQKDIKTEIRVINQTIDTQTDSLQKLSENIEDLDKDYNSDFKVVINRILDKVDILIQKK